MRSFFLFLFLTCAFFASAKEAPRTKSASKFQITENMDLKKHISKITVLDSQLKTLKLSNVINKQESLIIFVKPGCVFCESLLSVMETLKPKIRVKTLLLLDAAHTSKDDFKKKTSKVKDLELIAVYDSKNYFKDKLGVTSFPRFLYLDKNFKVVKHQIGLVVPEDKKSLENQEFSEVLQKLSEETINWIIKL